MELNLLLHPWHFMKGKEVIHFIPRHDIEGQPMEVIKENLLTAFNQVK